MRVTQISKGRFHHFHLARQLERHGLLGEIWTGYPRFKLRDELGIPAAKIKCFPWLQTPYMTGQRFGLNRLTWLNREFDWWAADTLDRKVSRQLKNHTTVVALSGSGLYAGRVAQRAGGRFVCDHGSSHIRYHDRILREEYQRWGLTFSGVDSRVIAKMEAEYALANAVTVPSEFARQSFLSEGVPAAKVVKIPYGSRLERFQMRGEPVRDRFVILWVGYTSILKGFPYLLDAFHKLQHPNKELIVIGGVQRDFLDLMAKLNLRDVQFKGQIPNEDLPEFYSKANVLVLPSITEGFGMVMGEAMACGCPVIASVHTGAADLFTNGVEGFIVPIRSPEAILEKLEMLAQNPDLRSSMSAAALKRVRNLGGWDAYGDAFVELLEELKQPPEP